MEIQLTSSDEQDIVIDLVEHGIVTDDVPSDQIGQTIGISGLPPGTPLSESGEQQAQDLGQHLFDELGGPGGVAGIYAGLDTRMPETVAPFAKLEEMDIQKLPGLDEIDGGFYAGHAESSPAGILFYLTELAWAVGLRGVEMPGSYDFNGSLVDEVTNNAINTMYEDALDNPVVSDNGDITTVAASGEAAIGSWVLMNVENPDIAFFIPAFIKSLTTGDAGGSFLPNSDVVEIEGNPEDGWVLDSWAGQDIPEDPGLLTDLIVDLRDVVVAPQTAGYNILQAALNGDWDEISSSFRNGIDGIFSSLAQFPGSVINDVVDDLQHLSGDLEDGESFSDAFGADVLGLV